MSGRLILALPSKGRMMQDCIDTFARAGLNVRKAGSDRGYRGEISEFPAVEVAFVSASEIAQQLRSGTVHLGITGEDLMRDAVEQVDAVVSFEAKLGFGGANVVVAVPAAWIDVHAMADLEHAAVAFRSLHGFPMRVATKYLTLTRQHFKATGVATYRIVESLGATEGAPAAGLAELIVDITSTGETLRANGLRILDDGVMLKSEANLIASRTAPRTPEMSALEADILRRITNSRPR